MFLPDRPSMLTQPLPGIVGLAKGGAEEVTNIAFDILSLEALLLVPRYVSLPESFRAEIDSTTITRSCALLSLHPYFGTLVSL